jgi:hypothetical protein
MNSVANDTVSSLELKPEYEQGRYNAFRIDKIELLVESHAGLADDDYFLIHLSSNDFNGDALGDLEGIHDDDTIERSFKSFEILGTNGPTTEVPDPAKAPIIFKFEHAFIQPGDYMNLLIHGLASARDVQLVIWGNPVNLPQVRIDNMEKGMVM